MAAIAVIRCEREIAFTALKASPKFEDVASGSLEMSHSFASLRIIAPSAAGPRRLAR
jgi:hypothetical protein